MVDGKCDIWYTFYVSDPLFYPEFRDFAEQQYNSEPKPKLFLFLGGQALLSDEFTKGQLPDVAADREESWGTNVLNKECYIQWRALACRLGMTVDDVKNVSVLRNWMETNGPVASVGRGIVREARSDRPGPSRIRRRDSETRDSDRSRWVRGRYDERHQNDNRSRSRSRGNTLNRGSSGQFQHRTRDD